MSETYLRLSVELYLSNRTRVSVSTAGQKTKMIGFRLVVVQKCKMVYRLWTK